MPEGPLWLVDVGRRPHCRFLTEPEQYRFICRARGCVTSCDATRLSWWNNDACCTRSVLHWCVRRPSAAAPAPYATHVRILIECGLSRHLQVGLLGDWAIREQGREPPAPAQRRVAHSRGHRGVPGVHAREGCAPNTRRAPLVPPPFAPSLDGCQSRL